MEKLKEIKDEVASEKYDTSWRTTVMENKPHRCPVWLGTGNVPGGFYNSTNFTEDGQVLITTGGTGSETCRSCNGQGIVWQPEFQYSSTEDIKFK